MIDLEKRKAYMKRKEKRAWEKFKVWRLQFKIKCSSCGYNKHRKILHFHHDKGNKSYNPNTIGTKGRFLEEIKKCVLLCPNCHAEKHLKK